METIKFRAGVLPLLALMPLSGAMAQDHDKEYWKDRKEAAGFLFLLPCLITPGTLYA